MCATGHAARLRRRGDVGAASCCVRRCRLAGTGRDEANPAQTSTAVQAKAPLTAANASSSCWCLVPSRPVPPIRARLEEADAAFEAPECGRPKPRRLAPQLVIVAGVDRTTSSVRKREVQPGPFASSMPAEAVEVADGEAADARHRANVHPTANLRLPTRARCARYVLGVSAAAHRLERALIGRPGRVRRFPSCWCSRLEVRLQWWPLSLRPQRLRRGRSRRLPSGSGPSAARSQLRQATTAL